MSHAAKKLNKGDSNDTVTPKSQAQYSSSGSDKPSSVTPRIFKGHKKLSMVFKRRSQTTKVKIFRGME